MKRRRQLLPIVALSCFAQAAAAADISFRGNESERTEVFETSGPWVLDWRATTETTLPPIFEMRLFDAKGAFLGTIVQLQDTGSGKKLFESAGRFRISVIARNVDWELDISVTSDAAAGRIKRATTGNKTLEDSVHETMSRVREGSFSSWRPEGDEALLLFSEDGVVWRATFTKPCDGLASATAISFMTAATGGLQEYDSILLENGTRCVFERVAPSSFR